MNDHSVTIVLGSIEINRSTKGSGDAIKLTAAFVMLGYYLTHNATINKDAIAKSNSLKSFSQ